MTLDPDWSSAPSHWERRRLKTLCSMRSGAGIHREDIAGHGLYPVYGGNGRRGWTARFTHDGLYPLVGRQGARCGNVHLVRGRFWASEHAVVVSAVREVDPRWLAHLLRFMDLGRYSQAAAQPGLAVDRIRALPAVVPPIEEQRLIARYFDHLDLHMTRAITSQRQLVGLLDEAVGAATWNAIASSGRGGTDGPAWMGTVPRGWERARVKALLKEVDCRTTTGQESLLSLRMREGLVLASAYSNKPQDPGKLVGYKLVGPQTLVMNRMRASIGLFGVAEEVGLVSPDYATFEVRPGAPIYLPFLLALLKSRQMGAAIRAESRGLGTGSSGFLRIYSDRFGAMPVALPPPDEQVRRADEAARRTERLDEALGAALREIGLLQEYRSRLIADVVTGRRDVRVEAADLPEVDPDELDSVLSATPADDDVDEDDGE